MPCAMLPDNLRKGSYRRGLFASIGQALPPGEPLSTEERIRILVWNIYKQQRAGMVVGIKELRQRCTSGVIAGSADNARVSTVCDC